MNKKLNVEGVMHRYVDMLLDDPALVIESANLVYEPNVYHPSHDKAGPKIGPEPKIIIQFRRRTPMDWTPDHKCRLEIAEDLAWDGEFRTCSCSVCGAEFLLGVGSSIEWLKAEHHYCHGCGREVTDVVLIEPEYPDPEPEVNVDEG